MKADAISETFRRHLRTSAFGLVLAMATIIFGQGMGIVFGLNEAAIKGRLRNSAAEVSETIYKGDDAAIKAVLDKSWSYMKRAHLHAGSMGTTAFGFILFLCLLGTSRWWLAAISIGLGAGGLGYSLFWMWAGFRAPALGSTDAAKESLKWLAMPSSGMFVIATVALLVVFIAAVVTMRSKHLIKNELPDS
ncbi:MAG: hypothetical protein ACXW3L_01925 [Limisphaerales bacterium]